MNIVVIIADQLRVDHLGYAGKVPVRTPHIDALAESGHRFDRAFVANPVCMPNRATIMTGQWPSAHGLRTNGLPLNPGCDTFVRALRRHGWRTSAVGKLHLQPMGYGYEEYQLDQIKAAMPELWEAAVAGPFGESFSSWEDFDLHASGEAVIPPDYYGFDDVTLVAGHGDRVSGNYVAWARERGFDPITQAGRKNAKSKYAGWNHVYESAVPAALHPTTFITDKAIERLDDFAKGDDPFVLFVSYPDPHHPFAPPSEYFHRHDPADMPLPDTFHDDHATSPQYVRDITANRGTPDVDPMMLWAPTEDQFRNALAAELGSIEFIDDSVGRIVDTIARLDLTDDTVIVFTSDHGDVFGDHGLILKHFTHYDAAVRVPLIISGGGVGTGRHHELASSTDIAPTLLELAGTNPMAGVQGASLVPIMHGAAGEWRSAILVEEDQPYGLPTLPGPVRLRTVITDALRYTRVAGTTISELYDLTSDPLEMSNCADSDSAGELRETANAVMVDELMRVVDDSKVPFHAA
jgi:arylsulfatase A-like enzyme